MASVVFRNGARMNQLGSIRKTDDPLISVVVPMFDEEEVIDAFFERLRAILDGAGLRYQVICVNDGSRDRTLAALLAHAGRDPRIVVVDLSRNFGKEAALSAGLARVEGDAAVVIDADLQDPPELIPDFVERWRRGTDVVIGVRADRSSDSFLKRKTAAWFYGVFNRISEVPLVPNAGDFRLMDRMVVDTLNELPERSRFMKGLFAWVGYRFELVEFARARRVAGEGKWRPWRLWNFALDGIFSFSTVPLRIWTYLGSLISLVSFGYMAVIIVRTLVFGIDVPGYASLVVIMLFSLSANLIGIGILGEYVARIHMETKARPLYVVSSVYRAPAGEERPLPRMRTVG